MGMKATVATTATKTWMAGSTASSCLTPSGESRTTPPGIAQPPARCDVMLPLCTLDALLAAQMTLSRSFNPSSVFFTSIGCEIRIFYIERAQFICESTATVACVL